jgi:hypothetical protein
MSYNVPAVYDVLAAQIRGCPISNGTVQGCLIRPVS